MANKRRYTPEQVIDALKATKGMRFLAAQRLGCSHDTITNYINRYASVKAAADGQRGEMVDTAELKLWQSIQNGEAWGITLCLKTLGKDRGYVERVEQSGTIEHTGEVLHTWTDRLSRSHTALEERRNGHAHAS